MKFAVACYAVNGILALVLAGRYWMADRYMPYHALASGTSWETLAPGVQFIVLALLKVAAAGMLAAGVLSLVVIAPIARGENWARWTALAGGLAFLLPLLYVTAYGRIASGAPFPVAPTALAVVVAIAGFVASRVPLRSTFPTSADLRRAPPAT